MSQKNILETVNSYGMQTDMKKALHKCEIIDDLCEHYSCQTNIQGEVVLTHCTHPNNPNKFEGNCAHKLCPITGKASVDFS